MAVHELDAGGYRAGLEPLDTETDVRLPVDGQVPPWLTGTLIRNGAARWTAGSGGRGQRVRHWFDGLAMLHRFAFRGGQVDYANRYLCSRAYLHATEHGEIGYREFGTHPHRSMLQRMRDAHTPPPPGSNASVNVVDLSGELMALTETPEMVNFDPDTLATKGPVTFDDDLPGVLTTAHPHFDTSCGNVTNYTVEYGRTSAYHVYEMPPGSLRRRLVATVPADRAAYMHTFAMTQHFVVLVEYPYLADALSLLAGRTALDSYRWQPRRGTRFTVVDRASGRVVARPVTAPFFCWHQVNAFEQDGAVLVDLPAIPGSNAMRQFLLTEMLGTGPRQPAGELRRYRIPLNGRPVTYRLLSATPVEFPRIAYPRVGGRPYRYAYGLSSAESLTTGSTDRLVKLDLEGGTTTAWSQPGCWPGEPVHVEPPDNAVEEDAGVVLSVVLDSRARRSFLLILDATTFSEQARVSTPHMIPLGFHGQYYSRLTGPVD